MSTIEVTDLLNRVGRVQVSVQGHSTEITEDEAVELLGTLADMLGFTLVERVQEVAR